MPTSNLIESIESTSSPRKRLFEAGEMKLLVLYFIAQSPKFSYDIIKDVASLVGGNYKPSTGTICPTIHYLEEHCYTEVKLSVDERKQYHITAKGLKHLAAHQDEVNKVLDRFNTRKQIHNNEQFIDIKRAMESLKTSLRLKLSHAELSSKDVLKIAEQIDQAAANITRL